MRRGAVAALALAGAAVGLPARAFSVIPLEAPGEVLKWGASHAAGSPGGEVTWGFVAAGTPGSPACLPYCAGDSLDRLPHHYPAPTLGNRTEPLPLARLHEAFQAAFDAWSAVADIRFRYLGVDESRRPFDDPAAGAPMIRIAVFRFAGTWQYCNSAAAFAPPPNLGTLAGDVFINANVGYQMTPAGDGDAPPSFPVPHGLHMTDLRHLALHETGHAIGLGSSDERDAVMCAPSLSVDCSRRVTPWHLPRADDIAGAQHLYGAPPGVERRTDVRRVP